MVRQLAGSMAAFPQATRQDDLLRTTAEVLGALTGARRVEAALFTNGHPISTASSPVRDAADGTGAAPPTAADPEAPLRLVLRNRDGQPMAEILLYPGGEPLSPAAEALAETVTQGVAMVLAHMEDAEALQAELGRHDRLLGAMAHAVRAALEPVLHAIPLLASAASAAPTVARAHALVAEHATRATRMLDDLLDLRRAEAGHLALHRVSCTLGAVVERAVAAVQGEADARAVRIEVHGADAAVLLMADQDRLAQALWVLLHNAVRFTPQSGVVVVRLAIRGPRDDGRAQVQVIDQGRGIPVAVLESVFVPQGSRAIHGDGAREGLHLGLALARHLVELHGGTLTGHSDGIGHGSTFTLTVPATPWPSGAPFPAPHRVVPGGEADAPSPGAARRRTLRILVVDDNRDAADALALLLSQEGHRVTVCYDGEEAARRQRVEAHEVVLLDIGLPGVSGYEVARDIRRSEDGTPSLVVALTGWGRPPDRRLAFEAGFDHHLVKPVAYPALRALLRPLLEARPEADAGHGV